MRSIFLFFLISGMLFGEPNLLPDPSIEEVKPKDQFGIPYQRWGGWIFEGIAEFRNGKIARSGKTCAEILNGHNSKVRLYTPKVKLSQGVYKFSFYIRGIDVQKKWGCSIDLNFVDNNYYKVPLEGDFDWTKVEIIKEVVKEGEYQGRIGLIGPGRVWIDDAEIIKIEDNRKVSQEPIVEKVNPIKKPDNIKNSVICDDCGYLNDKSWEKCYICGNFFEKEESKKDLLDKKTLESFETGKRGLFDTGEVVKENSTDGEFSLMLKSGYTSINYPKEKPGDWSEYDFLKFDIINKNENPIDAYIEIRDIETKDYWTRVNIYTIFPPGVSTYTIPLKNLYVGEKSRPGRPVDLKGITRFVINIHNPPEPVYIDNVRLEKDLTIDKIKVPRLLAFDFTPKFYSYMPGFITISPLTLYKQERGYGFTKPNIWKGFDFLQPDPLYQTALCLTDGAEFRVDLPNGKYVVFMNIDSPSGYWGEYQVYRERKIKINNKEVLVEKMNFDEFLKKYFRWADKDDYLYENTFDKYMSEYFKEKKFNVEVNDGKLLIQFFGQSFANTLSTMIIYPAEYSKLGEEYLLNLRERRRFYFDNYFKKIYPNPNKDSKGVIPEFKPTQEEINKGYVIFIKDWMEDIYQNSFPRREEIANKIDIFASLGEKEPIVFSIYPLKDLGKVKISVSDLIGLGKISKENIEIGVVSHRITRITSEGSVYTIKPRLVLPKDEIEIKKGITSTIWLTLNVPLDAQGGNYKGNIILTFNDGKKEMIDLNVRIFSFKLDEINIPAGPFGCKIPMPWYKEDIPDYDIEMYKKSLEKMREYGFTAFSGIPSIRINIKDKKIEFDFTLADKEMEIAKNLGFKMVCNYGASIVINGKNIQRGLFTDLALEAGFENYKDFLEYILKKIDEHAKEKDYLPIVFALYDEPVTKEAKEKTIEYCLLWKDITKNLSKIKTTGYTSLRRDKIDDLHISLATCVDIVSLNHHDEEALKILKERGVDWAFYNSGNRFTYGIYLYKIAKEKNLNHRIAWHWNICAGDPYYALDCREDDYSWMVTNSKKELIPTIFFIRLAEGLDDYRYLLTLNRLIKEKQNNPFAQEGKKFLEEILSSIKLDIPGGYASLNYREVRYRIGEIIEKLSANK
jgi:hypothetical protein